MNKYKREESARYDIEQTIFQKTGMIQLNPHGYALLLKDYLNLDRFLLCPFCLETSKLQEFILSTKREFNKWMGQCPKCKNKVLYKTLLAMLKFTPVEYAKWVFMYRVDGFWKKINFEQFNKRLYEMGISQEFWDEYKNLKGEYIEE